MCISHRKTPTFPKSKTVIHQTPTNSRFRILDSTLHQQGSRCPKKSLSTSQINQYQSRFDCINHSPIFGRSLTNVTGSSAHNPTLLLWEKQERCHAAVHCNNHFLTRVHCSSPNSNLLRLKAYCRGHVGPQKTLSRSERRSDDVEHAACKAGCCCCCCTGSARLNRDSASLAASAAAAAGSRHSRRSIRCGRVAAILAAACVLYIVTATASVNSRGPALRGPNA